MSFAQENPTAKDLRQERDARMVGARASGTHQNYKLDQVEQARKANHARVRLLHKLGFYAFQEKID